VSIPGDVTLKEFNYNSEVKIIELMTDMVVTATFQRADADWYIRTEVLS